MTLFGFYLGGGEPVALIYRETEKEATEYLREKLFNEFGIVGIPQFTVKHLAQKYGWPTWYIKCQEMIQYHKIVNAL